VDRYGKSVGIVVGTINSQGRQVVSYGKLDHGSGKRVDGDTLFEIGSITKVFTTILLADSVERGELSLDDPIAKFLPASVRVPTKNGKEITLLHLATHTSGLPRMIDNMGSLDVNNPYANYSVEKVYDFLSTCEIAGEIGVSPEYSNLGIDLLGHILELHLGITYEELVRSRITRPLGMDDTVITRTPEQTERMARGHSWRLTPMQNWDFPELPGSGALLSTVNDLLKFLAANLGLTMSPLTNAMRSTHEVRFDSDGEMAPVGLGWGISDYQGTEIVGHSGGTGGYRSLILFDLEQQTGVVVLSNSANDIDDIGAHLLVSEIDLAELEPSLQVIEIDPTIFDSYVGRYQVAENIFIDISREGERFYLKATDHSRFEIYPESETTYFAGVFRGKVMFARDERGVVDHLMLYEAGQETRAVRID
jgi:CubicO group peptidase (beta-lactamase class C family)